MHKKPFTGRAINSVSITAGRVSFSVESDQGQKFDFIRDGQNYYLQAQDGQNYQLRYENHSDQTF
ncbi:hypothetical protein [Acinetobacter sp. MB5]|uniref:hypothetical protein n=1 Tax=Acinetobacter sp. MB5 TaxID=2069438 RepID=UPI000DD0DED6|nr:hypothetical protein [Acinetobacter sp. MB5]